MSNGNSFERLWKLQAKVNMMVLDGKRDPDVVASALQEVLDGKRDPNVAADALQNTKGHALKENESCSWQENNCLIYFTVTSDGTTGENWIKRLEGNGIRFGGGAKQVLRSPDFKPTSGMTTEVAVLKGRLFEEDQSRTTKNICAEADKRKLRGPNAELACLIREKFTDKEIEQMGLWYIVVMHEPLVGSNLLGACRSHGGRWFDACDDQYGHFWDRDVGFAFAVRSYQTGGGQMS